MSIENKKTVEIYKEKASTYLATSIEHDKLEPEKANRKREKLNNFLRNSFQSLPKNAKILEIGSANGENAKYIESLGYNVTASDIAEDFINASKNNGLTTINFNILEDNFKEKYSGILAWRVFVHFTEEDIFETLKKSYDNLENNGIFIFNVINRETRNVDNEWVDFPNEYHMGAERYYHYFNQKDLDDIISQTKFQIQDFHKEGGDNNNKWLVYVLKK